MQYTAIVHKRITSMLPVLDGLGRPVFLDAEKKPVQRDEQGNLPPGNWTQKLETIESVTIDDPVTDEAGNVIVAGTEEALLRKVMEHYSQYENVTILSVLVQRTETVREVSGKELGAVI